MIFKFARESIQTQYKEGETDIENVLETNFPFIYIIFDIKHQIVFIEFNTSSFQDINTAKSKLQRCFQIEFIRFGFEVIFEEISDENSFWTYVDEGKRIYDVGLTLNSPNLFDGWAQTSEMVRSIRQRYNNTKTKVEISNSKAPLTSINRNNEDLAAAIKYTSAGGGEWKLTVHTVAGKRTFRSRNNIKKVSFHGIEDEANKADIDREIIKSIGTIETILPKDDKHGQTES